MLVLPWVVLAWMIGVFARALWITSAWLAVRRLARSAAQPIDAMWARVLEQLQRELRVDRHVGLRLSALVDVPCVIGWLRPIILLPPAACLGLSPQQLEAALAHELAHIKRHDRCSQSQAAISWGGFGGCSADARILIRALLP